MRGSHDGSQAGGRAARPWHCGELADLPGPLHPVTRAGWETSAGAVAQVGTVLADAPWWVAGGAFVLLVMHRILPRDLRDLLSLWLRILPGRDEGNDPPENGQPT